MTIAGCCGPSRDHGLYKAPSLLVTVQATEARVWERGWPGSARLTGKRVTAMQRHAKTKSWSVTSCPDEVVLLLRKSGSPTKPFWDSFCGVSHCSSHMISSSIWFISSTLSMRSWSLPSLLSAPQVQTAKLPSSLQQSRLQDRWGSLGLDLGPLMGLA